MINYLLLLKLINYNYLAIVNLNNLILYKRRIYNTLIH